MPHFPLPGEAMRAHRATWKCPKEVSCLKGKEPQVIILGAYMLQTASCCYPHLQREGMKTYCFNVNKFSLRREEEVSQTLIL